jgi:hypothetical protein
MMVKFMDSRVFVHSVPDGVHSCDRSAQASACDLLTQADGQGASRFRMVKLELESKSVS